MRKTWEIRDWGPHVNFWILTLSPKIQVFCLWPHDTSKLMWPIAYYVLTLAKRVGPNSFGQTTFWNFPHYFRCIIWPNTKDTQLGWLSAKIQSPKSQKSSCFSPQNKNFILPIFIINFKMSVLIIANSSIAILS